MSDINVFMYNVETAMKDFNWTREDLASFLGVSVRTIERWMKIGEMPFIYRAYLEEVYDRIEPETKVVRRKV